jgi:hypothetical protein
MSKFLVVVNGESFRYGGQFTRTRGINDSYDRQYLASISHLSLLRHIEKKYNMQGEILLSTYSLNESWDHDLKQWYTPYLVKSDFLSSMMQNELEFRKYHIKLTEAFIQSKNKEYEFILFVRTDFYFKKYLFDTITLNNTKILFGFIDSNTTNETSFPSVAHNLAYIPKAYFIPLFNLLFYEMHDSAYKAQRYIESQSIGFFSNTFHLASTDLDWNPLYVAVGRKECLEHTSPNRQFVDNMYIDNTIDFTQPIFKETFQEALDLYKTHGRIIDHSVGRA